MNNMNQKYSNKYAELYEDIKKSSAADMEKSIIKKLSDKVKKYEVYIAMGLIFFALICIISIVVCLFTSWKTILIVSIISLIITALLFFLSIYFTVIVDAIVQVKKADKYIREQKLPFHYAVAGYYYYQAKNTGIKLAKKRFEKLLETPEFLEYFSVNGLAYDERIEFRGLSEFEIHLKYFRKYVTEYYGTRLKKTEDFELFHETNLGMYASQIKNYDVWTQPEPIEDSSLYSKASQYYLNWCGGDIESRELLKEIYLKDEVWDEYSEYMKGVGEYCKKNNMPITHISLKNEGFNMFLSKAHNQIIADK